MSYAVLWTPVALRSAGGSGCSSAETNGVPTTVVVAVVVCLVLVFVVLFVAVVLAIVKHYRKILNDKRSGIIFMFFFISIWPPYVQLCSFYLLKMNTRIEENVADSVMCCYLMLVYQYYLLMSFNAILLMLFYCVSGTNSQQFLRKSKSSVTIQLRHTCRTRRIIATPNTLHLF